MHCRMNLTEYPIQTQTPQFVNLVFLTINALDEGGRLSTPATRILRPMDGAHWSAPSHIFSETSAVRVRGVKSYYIYNYKNELQIWK